MKRFWMVYSPFKSEPTKQHSSLDAAIEEATRLAEKEHVEFFVLRAVRHIDIAPSIKIRGLQDA